MRKGPDGDVLRYHEKIISSCATSDNRRVMHVAKINERPHSIISDEREKNGGILTTTNGTYPLSSVTQDIPYQLTD